MNEVSRRTLLLTFAGSAICGAGAVALRAGAPGRSAVTRGRGAWTSFGSVAVLGAHQHPAPAGLAQPHGHTGGRHAVWPNTVLAEVEVHNGTKRPVLLSPGQFRLRVGHDGPTVTYYDAERPVAALPAGMTERMWISYLAPSLAADLYLEYTEAGGGRVLSTPLRTGTTVRPEEVSL